MRTGPPGRASRAAAFAAFALVATLLVGCGAPEGAAFSLPPVPPPGEVLPSGDPARVLADAGLSPQGDGTASWQRVEMAYEVRPALVTPAGGWAWRGEVPRGARLHLGAGAPAATWSAADRLEVVVTVRPLPGLGEGDDAGEAEVVARAVLDRPPPEEPEGNPVAAPAPSVATPPWRDLEVDLSPWAGRPVELAARVAVRAASPGPAGPSPPPGPSPPDVGGATTDPPTPAGAVSTPLVAWSPLYLGPPPGGAEHLAWSRRNASAGGDAATAADRPNVVLIVIDTLRADHLGAYGYARDTSPRIDELLAARGVVAEQAWAQAPWTLPSAVSYFTGRYPGELLPDLQVEFAIPPGTPSLAERFRALGYRTAGFYANPTLHAGNGFARGFESFYTPAPTTRSLRLHGDTLTRRAVPWVRAHAGQPFFLYVHYVDPHDPYTAPVTEATGRSPFAPGYDGPANGDWPHGLFTGELELPDPQRDLEHLVALYDSEIKYVDQQIGHLLHAIPDEVMEDTLVVLTSDHGEELLDHGWWKHGVTVYQEQLRVPLVVRWDRRLPAGRRVERPVELVDLVPTLLAAVGEEVEDGIADGAAGEGLDGVDLLPLLAGDGPGARADGFAQHLSAGPVRAAVRLGDWKLVLFDRHARYTPADGMQEALYGVALDRFARVELYDLATDPGEAENVATGHPRLVERLAPLVLRQLDAQGRPGLRLAAGAVPAGRRLAGEIRFQRPPEGWESDFLAAGDRVSLDGPVLRFELVGEGWPKGVRVLGEPGGVETARLELDGEEVAAGRLGVGGRPWSGGPVDADELLAEGWPPAAALAAGDAAAAPLLDLWAPAGRAAPVPRTPADDAMARETERRLRALGYIQ